MICFVSLDPIGNDYFKVRNLKFYFKMEQMSNTYDGIVSIAHAPQYNPNTISSIDKMNLFIPFGRYCDEITWNYSIL